ncbi:hypothetical protein FEM48_Zijuj08G0205800 [Ziziphus jujuba var. spinosa]|uniref:Pentatricopeptide repeat-containing protein n=1 Tax=Ziziphus jujuba var. spinosa TaxID=714518 RepID=A0A978V191_ZIZJJ|nr:hypothetical protein FEM48_Zijuj08G0205800 [Ziziphus jujuba var. spinosa]
MSCRFQVSQNSLMDNIASKVSNVSHLRQLHAHLIRNSLHIYNHWLALLLSHCTRHRAPLPYTRLVFDSASNPDIHVFTSMLKYYTHLGTANVKEVVSLYQKMQACDVKLETFVYPVLIKNVVTWTAMLTGYAKTKDLEKARDYFDRMPEKNVVSWNAMISGYAQNGIADETFRLFDKMINSGVQPNETTWMIIISSCSSRGDPVLADLLIRKLNQRQVHLSKMHKFIAGDVSHEQSDDIYKLLAKLRSPRNLGLGIPCSMDDEDSQEPQQIN